MPENLGYQFVRTFAGAIEQYRQLATIAARDAIPTGVRYEGLLCYVTSEDADYQLRGGITNLDWTEVASGGGSFFDTVTDDSDDITEGLVNLFLTAAERAKLGFITITQAVDLDQLESDVAALGSGVTFKGTWSPSGGSFPGGGVTAIGDLYIADDGGTIDSVTFAAGDGIIATVVNASTTTFAANWAKTESVSDVTSVVGLTGVISKSALLAALNVEDGATADQTGSEISSAITTFLTSNDWQTKLTQEEVEDFVGAMIGTQTNITVTYDDSAGDINFVVDDFIQVYGTLATLIAGQGDQADNRLYEVTDASGFTTVTSGKAWVRWLGTTDGDEDDYVIVSKAETTTVVAPIPLTYADDTTLFAGQGNQTLNYIYEVTDGSGFTGVASGTIWVKYLGTTVGDETDYIIVSKANSGAGDLLAANNLSDVGSAATSRTNLGIDTTANQTDSTDKRFMTDAQETKLDSVESGADVTDATNVDAAGAVMESDYNAQTILHATSDNTPVALTVAEQTLVGRITGGNIDSLTISESKTLLSDRLETDATVTGTKNIDWTAYETFRYTLTGACTFSDTNLPASGKTKVITIYMTGNFAPTYPSGWSDDIIGAYDGAAAMNQIVVEYISSGEYFVTINQPD